LEEFLCEVQTYSKRLLTGLAKGVAEEHMKRRSLNVAAAQDIIIVISSKPLLFSSQNVSCIQSIHREKPFGVLNSEKMSWRFPNPDKWIFFARVKRR